ncbi:MAG: hypothetical protein HYS17_05540 [Micavibrio aeruginosavorus]|uniref:Uncharacterized protein n=1 Tax=Micavibrio aeruginosavorus TaxID=349221 RepID=A0A7T5R4F1_9BACT|nr:MAG: hypothetical protein HYS17_05540 [Micavibrio aeruginosavorus]
MGGLFKLLAKELFSLGTLFFIIVPFMLSMTDDYAARNSEFGKIKNTTENLIYGSLDGGPHFDISSGLGGGNGGGSYVSGRPIRIPQQ